MNSRIKALEDHELGSRDAEISRLQQQLQALQDQQSAANQQEAQGLQAELQALQDQVGLRPTTFPVSRQRNKTGLQMQGA